jgi:hypothetical protein
MNNRNRKLRNHFTSAWEYTSAADNRAVRVIKNEKTTTVLGFLHKSAIVKKIIDEHGSSTVWINYCNWRTRTTTKAMNACIPAGWTVRGGRLYTPKQTFIVIPDTGWVMLEEPINTYFRQWGFSS